MPDANPLRNTLQSIIDKHHGDVALFAMNLATGQNVEIRADNPVQTASTIKLAILYEAMQQIRSGQARLEDPIVLRKEDQVPRSGVLLFFDTPITLTLKDALTMMISMSDNTATNLVIDHIGLASVNARMQQLGLTNTCLNRKVFRPAADSAPKDHESFGLGKTTPREMAHLMREIVTCEWNEPGARNIPSPDNLRDQARYMLTNQFYRGGIPRYLSSMYSDTESAIANKTGELNAVRNDVSAIFAKRALLILSIFTYNNHDQCWSVENEGEVTIARLARAIVTAWSPESL